MRTNKANTARYSTVLYAVVLASVTVCRVSTQTSNSQPFPPRPAAWYQTPGGSGSAGLRARCEFLSMVSFHQRINVEAAKLGLLKHSEESSTSKALMHHGWI